MEIPHFAALRGTERELVILRSETGESWREHHCDFTEEELNQILNGMDESKGSELDCNVNQGLLIGVDILYHSIFYAINTLNPQNTEF